MAEENKLSDRKREDSKEDQLSLSRGQCTQGKRSLRAVSCSHFKIKNSILVVFNTKQPLW